MQFANKHNNQETMNLSHYSGAITYQDIRCSNEGHVTLGRL